MYGGLGLCNGQLDVACSLGAAGPPEVPGGGCSDPAHATAGVEAGEQYVDPRTDRRYQEPALTTTGPCASGIFSGVLFATWRDHRLSILSVTSTGGVLTGKVLDRITLKPVHGGRPLTLRSTEFAGGTVSGSLSLASCVTGDAVPQVPFFGTPFVGVVSGNLTVTG
jgi:hypothetical protein